jgi:hypothetical protein
MVKPAAVMFLFVTLLPNRAIAQDRAWVVEGTLGSAGLVDDATKYYWVAGGGLRRYVTPRLSVGPEVVVMGNSGLVTDRLVMTTGNVMLDGYPKGVRRLTPFVVGGFGLFISRDQVRNGPFWSNDPAFTAGGGVRARVGERASIDAEYRLGWELHQRLTAAVGFHW